MGLSRPMDISAMHIDGTTSPENTLPVFSAEPWVWVLWQVAGGGNCDLSQYPHVVTSEMLSELLAVIPQNGRGWRVLQDANFSSVTFASGTVFEKVIFAGRADFSQAIFGAEGGFEQVRFENKADFNDAVFADQAVFARTVFWDGTSFEGVRFGKGTSFDDVSFGNGTSFNGAVFEDGIGFFDTTFEDGTSFFSASFGDGVLFFGAVFGNGADFSSVKFGRNARLLETSFENGTSFFAASFGENTSFEETSFAAGTSFREALFDTGARFRWNRFENGADFTAVRCEDLVFEGRTKEETGLLQLSSLSGMDLGQVVLCQVDVQTCRFIGAKNLDRLSLSGKVVLPGAHKRRAFLFDEMEWRRKTRFFRFFLGLVLPLSPSFLFPRWREDAVEIGTLYRELRKGQEEALNEVLAADFYYGEMEMRRWSAAWGTRFVTTFYWLLSGYGVRPSRACVALVCLWLSGALLLQNWGFVESHSFTDAWTIAVSATVYLVDFETEELTIQGRNMLAGLRLLGPVACLLVALALRGRVKR